MKREPRVVECIGTCALVSFWEVAGSRDFTQACLGKWGGSLLGNDAVITARELIGRGVSVRCQLLDPTADDIARVASELGLQAVVAVGGGGEGQTHSLCLQDDVGRRSWVFSRVPDPRGELGEFSASLVYVDYYPELVTYLNRHLGKLSSKGLPIMVNLSGITDIFEIPTIAVRPLVVQASVAGNLSLNEAAQCALQLVQCTGAEKVLVTMGVRGAILAVGRETWHHSEPPVKNGRNILGAGAVFSAEVIEGLLAGLDREELLERSVRRTAARLQSWELP